MVIEIQGQDLTLQIIAHVEQLSPFLLSTFSFKHLEIAFEIASGALPPSKDKHKLVASTSVPIQTDPNNNKRKKSTDQNSLKDRIAICRRVVS
jgi:hypothetical protein